jgi:hypothetical protein
MSRRRLGSLAGVSALFLLASGLLAAPAPAATPCTSPPATFPTNQMTAGMTGVGYSVIKGQTVEPFDVEILGVLPNYIFLGVDVIVAKMTGPPAFLNTTGGAVAGMSGSPVYIGGKLAGAGLGVAEDRRIFGLPRPGTWSGSYRSQAGRGAMPETVSSRLIRRAIARHRRRSRRPRPDRALPVPLGVSTRGPSAHRRRGNLRRSRCRGERVPFRAPSRPRPRHSTRPAPGEGSRSRSLQ